MPQVNLAQPAAGPEPMRLTRRRVTRPLAIGLTPLIDVVFILLLFFMLASSLTRLQAVPLQSPVIAEAQHEPPPTLLLRIQVGGSLDLNGEAATEATLASALRSRLARHPELTVIVQPADAVDLQQLMRVFDEVAAAGVSVLRLQ